MKIQQSKKALDTLLEAASGKSLKDVFGVMLSFYAQTRAEDCNIDEDGDMLLLQWDTTESDEGAREFSIEIARQFILADEGEPFQLHLTAYFSPTPKLSAIEDGNEWCGSPDALGAFQEFMAANAAYRLLKDQTPVRVETSFEQC